MKPEDLLPRLKQPATFPLLSRINPLHAIPS
jgi:hypothetical protein